VLAVTPLSRRALETRFQKVIGRTPHQEINRLKLQRVKELLLEPSLSLQTIADLTGFKHPEYLSVFFKRETGLAPSDYRSSVMHFS
jgi:LacI family transcriptional regulator